MVRTIPSPYKKNPVINLDTFSSTFFIDIIPSCVSGWLNNSRRVIYNQENGSGQHRI
jgi:hypothetical protein